MRHLAFALKERFDGLPRQKDPTAMLIAVARSCVGINMSQNQDIVALFESTISRPIGQSWCLDFMQSCIGYVEQTFNVVSPLAATELCMNVWDTAPDRCKVQRKPGDLIIWQLHDSIHGHVGMYLSEDANLYQTVEGNTTPAHYIENQGDGVYLKNRAKGGSETFKELGFLRVFP